MSACENCHRNMNNLNIVFCSIECRKGITKKGSGASLDLNDMKTPPLEANIGLRRPYGSHEIII
ncbi:MAG: hypothetical protein KAS32_24485 [Candidatus Peribacteraceae bacterium]|nr:hypothetical protein [Candidatus Peribacteraceae bacterium]